ncbi:unnamed protein product [Cylindrotheca closterium]|uniref:Helicase-associated domain-containing protein n=1 Tax=Cylindrotheca closterium TaxID=2856 RepID=A0AAD2JHP5_9STRA|nr:unnamed protein product [Cylindrotheca closterium]CAJ1958014.1 unnamed protein product [Cylindrotheca closterium]
MIVTANNDNLRGDSFSFSKIEDDELVSLLTSPLLSMDGPCSSLSYLHLPPFSFDDPFDDPRMEPSPIESQDEGTHNAHQIMQSLYDRSMQSLYDTRLLVDESIFSEEDNKSNDTSKVGPTIDPTSKVGSKTSFGDFFSHNDEEPYCSTVASSKRSREGFFLSSNHNNQGNQENPAYKRQRTTTSHAAQSTFGEESTPRFRPYQDKQWRAQLQKLIQYKMKNGHCCVPHSYQEDPVLARWVKRQRYQYKKFNDNNPTSTMTTRRIQELESIGFIWQSHASAWQEKLNELKAFKQRTGHCNVPSDYCENPTLATWVKCQRRQYKLYAAGASAPSTTAMTVHRLQTLESLGFVFEPQTAVKTSSRCKHDIF